MIQDIVKTVVLSAVARITENISTLYIGIGATLIVLVCSYFIYNRFFSQPAAAAVTKQVEEAPQMEEASVQHQRPTPEQLAQREEAFAAAMQAEQEAMEHELQKRHAEQAAQQKPQESSNSEKQEFDEEYVQPS